VSAEGGGRELAHGSPSARGTPSAAAPVAEEIDGRGSPAARGTPAAAARTAEEAEVEREEREAHARRIQFAWWDYRVNVLDPRKDSERAAEEQRIEARSSAVQPKSREVWIMDKKVGKRRRKLPLLGFKPKQMQLDSAARVLSYWKFDEQRKARVRSIELDAVTALEQRNLETEWLLVISLSTGPTAKATAYTFKMADKEASDVWLKYLTRASPPNTQISTSNDGGAKHARFVLREVAAPISISSPFGRRGPRGSTPPRARAGPPDPPLSQP
jgi:hypothetical protein